MRSGNILYYSSIPTDVPAASYNHTVPNSTITNQDQRFWKEYIDFALGVWRDPFGNVQTPGSSTCSYGPDFACGDGTGVSITGPDTQHDYNGIAFVAPTDNPLRPRHRFWFGPMTMIQYMLDTSISPGTFHDISMVPAKLGIAGAITDIQNNHPNDMVSMIYYARPELHRRAERRRHVRQSDQLAGPQLHQLDQLALVSAQQQHGRRPPLGRQRQSRRRAPTAITTATRPPATA